MGRNAALASSILLVTEGEVPAELTAWQGLEPCRDAATAIGLLEREGFDLVIWDPAVADLPDAATRARWAQKRGGGRWLLLGGAAPAAEDLAAGVVDHLQLPEQAPLLGQRVQLLLEGGALEARNRDLEGRFDAVETCRVLDHCLEAGKVYPLVLDLLLEFTEHERGIALFRRSAVPGSYGSVFRGFGEEESERLHGFLLEGKRPDLDAYPRMEVVDHGDLVVAFRDAGVHAGALLVVPVRGREGEQGLICVPEDDRPFGEEQRELAALVRERACTALVIAENYELAKERAFIDDVTQVYNARYLLGAAENEIRRAERYGTPLSMLFLDLDRFKRVNDLYGHLAGSETLRRLVAVLKENVREIDTLARYGGDEFAILLGGTTHSDALAIAERIRGSVERHLFEVGTSQPLRLTISIGVASLPVHGVTNEALLNSADKAMYRAKSNGRNRICSADELVD